MSTTARYPDTMLMKRTHTSLYGVGLFYRDGVYRNFWQLKVVFSNHQKLIVCSSGNSVALYLASLAEVGQGRSLTRLEIAAIAWGVNILSGIINTFGTKAISKMSSFNVWWTLGGTFVLAITLLVKSPVKVLSLLIARGLHRR